MLRMTEIFDMIILPRKICNRNVIIGLCWLAEIFLRLYFTHEHTQKKVLSKYLKWLVVWFFNRHLNDPEQFRYGRLNFIAMLRHPVFSQHEKKGSENFVCLCS